MLDPTRIEAILTLKFESSFNGHPLLEGFNKHIWSEGGEWPLLTTVQNLDIKSQDRFYVPSLSEPFIDCDQAIDYALSILDKSNVVSVPLDHTISRSVFFVLNLFSAGLYKSVICIQHSSIAAFTNYYRMKDEFPATSFSRFYDSNETSICYRSMSEFITGLHKGQNFDKSLIILVEPHSPNPTYAALLQLMKYTAAKLLITKTVFHSANYSQRKKIKFLTLKPDSVELKVIIDNDNVKVDDRQVLFVGTLPGPHALHKSARHIEELTLKLDVVIDTGTRINPVIRDNVVTILSRAATHAEKMQTYELLRQSDNSVGKYYLISSTVSPIRPNDYEFYEVIYYALLAAFGQDFDYPQATFVDALSCRNTANINNT
jgi:hypothetical protein